ncbi:MAG: hypothetical protein LQ344_001222 [Seirophora lacunosa]|nr:MAG: hypothetical protein LQ344_001222 [Seirophora lacunosa]
MEERRAQRLRDSAIGLVYFDTFEEVESWNVADLDPIQQANQPLLRRSAAEVCNTPDNDCPKTKLLLCHDYKGGYHHHESVRPAPMTRERYSCKYLQFVDTFIYFSHKLVCIPPPTWVNALHRNGVQVLGTFLIEPQTPHMDRLLMRKEGLFVLAKQLAAITDAYGFDGWLLNIEQDSPNPYGNWSNDLATFLSDLRGYLGMEKKVIWYDALTAGGDVYYQNGLTSSNCPFAEATNCLFTNYKWTEKKLAETSLFAKDIGFPTTNVFFGIDLWAQNTNMPSPRVTYPPEGGGGTNTGLVNIFKDQSDQPSRYSPLLGQGPGQTLRVGLQASLSSQSPEPNLLPTLAKTWDDINKVASIDIRGKQDSPDMTCGFSMTFFDLARQVYDQVPYMLHPRTLHQDTVVDLPIQQDNAMLVAIGIFVEGESDLSMPIALMEITRIVIRPKQAVTTDIGYGIANLHVKSCSHGTNVEKRIAWDWESVPQQHGKTWPEGMPWSRTTGPFSSFTVRIGDEIIGEAYCLEFPVRNEDLNVSGEMITISVAGHLFGGGLADSASITIARAILTT